MPRRRNIVLGLALTLVSEITDIAQQPVTPQPSPAHKKLAAFVGTWKDEAEIKPSPLGPGGKMSLTETCNWFTGGFSIVCYSETTGVMGELKALTVFTYDPEEKVYRFYECGAERRSERHRRWWHLDI